MSKKKAIVAASYTVDVRFKIAKRKKVRQVPIRFAVPPRAGDSIKFDPECLKTIGYDHPPVTWKVVKAYHDVNFGGEDEADRMHASYTITVKPR